MQETPGLPSAGAARANAKRRPKWSKTIWMALRQPLARSRVAKRFLVWLLANLMGLIRLTNRRIDQTDDAAIDAAHTPAIIALWHGQHLLAPCYCPKNYPLVVMVSRSADAELNALVIEKLGFQAVRGSGGRRGANSADKGGATALIALKKSLVAGKNVAMIADIPHGTPRQSGMGIVTLAKLSGRPIIPLAVATSRRKVLEKSWDKTTINLPFGRAALILGEPMHVPADATDEECEAFRVAVTDSLNAATRSAYQLVDGPA